MNKIRRCNVRLAATAVERVSATRNAEEWAGGLPHHVTVFFRFDVLIS